MAYSDDPECPSCGSIDLGRPPHEDEEMGADYECQRCGQLSVTNMDSDDLSRFRPPDATSGMLLSELLGPEPSPKQRIFNDRRQGYRRP